MNIAVCVKQVMLQEMADESKETDGASREASQLVNNANDYYAVEEALKLKDRYGGTVTCLSMGPEKCREQLRDFAALGVDRIVLLSGRDFAGADTLATSYTLAAGIRKLGGFQLVLTGEQSLDGETGQVGPSLAEQLGIVHVANVSEICSAHDDREMVVKRELEDRDVTIKLPLPALLCIRKHINQPRIPSVVGLMKAKTAQITVWGPDDLGIKPGRAGLSGSPTRVVGVYHPAGKERAVNGEIVRYADNRQCAARILSKIGACDDKGTGVFT
ncbi:electron transfer flavoprotein subunit beta/FixA family protein [Paenibacillus tyrfis]|uniref:electron transfer flavoprotein subunit beta/FixA family protein n=1 Tax=Paenibacillus tyrfis TaxID=1501230 RepID=UPI00068EC095|nr:electron transfer flavoprotein subunit beta/FixA family protein [Paenibacillus tyrfis]